MANVSGKIVLKFNGEATASQMEELLAQYPHEKVFSKKHDAFLGRLYVIAVEEGNELETVNHIKQKYGLCVDYVYQPTVKNVFD